MRKYEINKNIAIKIWHYSSQVFLIHELALSKTEFWSGPRKSILLYVIHETRLVNTQAHNCQCQMLSNHLTFWKQQTPGKLADETHILSGEYVCIRKEIKKEPMNKNIPKCTC